MAIHFSCASCGKALFAQEQYSGRVASCPHCHVKNTIPAPPPEQAAVPGGPQLAEMERIAQPDQPVAAAPVAVAPVAPEPPAPPPVLENAAPVEVADAEPTRRCPMCAETIKAAARKCRFCGALLDESLKAEEEQKRRADAAALAVALAMRSANTWRTVAIVFTRVTAFWLIFLTAQTMGEPEPPWPLVAFNVLLVIGLLWTARQMRGGPHHVFLAAACAILVCMPINFSLNLPVAPPTAEDLEAARRFWPQNREPLTLTELATMRESSLLLVSSAIGLLFSIPVWIASFKVAGLQRLRKVFGGPHGA